MIRKVFARFNDKQDILCICNHGKKKCHEDTMPEDCCEYFAKFTNKELSEQRRMSKSSKQHDSNQRTLSSELKCNSKENPIDKIKSILKG